MEEFRAFLADRLTLSLINRQQLRPIDFRNSESGAVLLNDNGFKKVLIAWQKRKQGEIVHPYIHEKMPIGLIPHIQAKLLAKSIRGDIDGYPPFIWR
jgi:CRISPR-associated protein Cas1